MTDLAESRDSDQDSIAHAVLAIGKPSFPGVLMDAFRRTADVGHCMVFTFDGERSASCKLNIGNIPIGGDLGAAYSQHFHLADPNRDVILQHRSDSSPILLPTFARRMYSDPYRRLFFDDSAIVDKFAAAIWVDRICFYVNFYRTLSQGRFSRAQLEYLMRAAPIAISAVASHFRAEVVPQEDPFRLLETAFSTNEPLTVLTRREREVCMRILTGFTSEGISKELGISLQSTLTYRKRAYDKLRISSQSELFRLAIQSLFSASRPN